MRYIEQKMNNHEIKDLYKNHKVIIWGSGYQGQLLSKVYRGYGIKVIAFFDNNEALQGNQCQGIPVISFQELSAIAKKEESIVVKIAVDCRLYKTAEKEIVARLEEIHIKDYIVFSKGEYEKEILQDAGFAFVGSGEKKKIPITKIDENLSMYRNNQVVLFLNEMEDLSNAETVQLNELFEYNTIDVDFLCVMNVSKCADLEYVDKPKVLRNTPVISVQALGDMVKTDKNIMVQLAVQNNVQEILNQLKNIGILKYIVLAEATTILTTCFYVDMSIKKANLYSLQIIQREEKELLYMRRKYLKYHEYVINQKNKSYIFICSMAKTGDHTLNGTFQKNNIQAHNMFHGPENFNQNDFDLDAKIKVLTATREPIGRSLSMIYQRMSHNRVLEDLYQSLYPFMKESFVHQNGDAQYILDNTKDLVLDNSTTSRGFNFLKRFSENIIDIQNAPFDQEKGYGIVQEGNIEVFIYQLEKMNDLVKEISDFVGTPFDTWEMGNVAADKWIANSYKQAQKEIKISKEFFDMSYNEPWVSHFYSETDIEKFKEKWRPHIKEEQ